MSKEHMGSSLDDFLKQEGDFDEAQAQAIKEVVAWQLAEAMKKQNLSKNKMATLLKTSRTQVNRLLDPGHDITLSSLQRAAAIVGRRVNIELVKEVTRAQRIADRLQNFGGANSAFRHAMDSIRRHEELTRAVYGPLSEWQREMDRARQAMEDYHARFKLPEITETARYLTTFNDALAEAMARYAETSSSLESAMESMSTPWMNIQEAMRSVTGFAEIQGIGRALRTLPAFDAKLTDALRVDLGDWRDSITWPPEVLTDLAARSDFYIRLGFNPELTDFPLPAFEQCLDIAGLPRELPPPAGDQEAGKPRVGDDREEEGLDRTNVAHDNLQRLERQMREFIDEQMSQAYGPIWAKHRLPNGLYDQWCQKKRKAEEAGAEGRRLIEYADFTDYPVIICRNDNWREVFEVLFVRQESVRESFQRLHPIRLDVAHSRLITQEDELLLRVEGRRLVKVIEKQNVAGHL